MAFLCAALAQNVISPATTGKNLHSQPFRRHATTAPETSTAFPGNIYCQIGRKGSGCRPIWQWMSEGSRKGAEMTNRQ